MNILRAMRDASFVQIGRQIFVAGYSCDPDDALVADDIVLEASGAGVQLEWTFDDIQDAVQVGPAAYRLRSGAVLYFLVQPTIH
ncbi:MAG: hypothetical protein ABI831_23125 [Betaproteobacteria bacterium]